MASPAVQRYRAENYILASLIAFAITVIVTRTFLHLTGFPQLGNNVLHIAHALWGGILLIVAVYLPLAYANHWALQSCALLSGLGIGLFIDEIGKFITQANYYFFPPALPLIYGFILLLTLLYFYFRLPRQENPRNSMYHILDGVKDALDDNLDAEKTSRIETQLAVAKQSDRKEIQYLANALSDYLQMESEHLAITKPSFWKRTIFWIDAIGIRLGRRRHRAIISIALLGWIILVAGYIETIFQGGRNLDPQVLQWRVPLILFQVIVGILIVIAAILWLLQREDHALIFGIGGFLISLIALQLLYFYISPFLAITLTLLELAILQVLFAYRRWYFNKGNSE